MITGRKRRAADRDCAVPEIHHAQGETPDEPDHQPAGRRRPLRGLAHLTIAPPGAVVPRPTGAAAPSRAATCPWGEPFATTPPYAAGQPATGAASRVSSLRTRAAYRPSCR